MSATVAVGREGHTELNVHVPEDATPGERLWYRVRVRGKIGDREAEGVGWFTGLAVEPWETELAPVTNVPQPPGGRLPLLLKLRSNLPGSEGQESQLNTGCPVPKEPGVVPFQVDNPFEDPPKSIRRWLRFTRAKATVAELGKLTPARVGVQFRGKGEEPLGADSGAQFRAVTNVVGGVGKAGFFCHPPYRGGVGCAFGEFEVVLPEEACAFETFVGFTDGSTTADGCVFSVEVKAGEKWETAGRLQLAELKRWMPFVADLSRFKGKKVALRLVTDVGPADDSNSDWAAWGEPRIVLAGERLAVEVLDKKPVGK